MRNSFDASEKPLDGIRQLCGFPGSTGASRSVRNSPACGNDQRRRDGDRNLAEQIGEMPDLRVG